MRLHRFFNPEIIGDKTNLKIDSADLVNQVSKVFRLKTGDPVIVFDGSGFDYECSIAGLSKEQIELNVIKKEKSHFVPAKEINLYASIVKKDTFEWIVEKATELGVTNIVPVMSERSEKKSLNEGRLKKIAIEASEQSGRGGVPEISSIKTLEEALKDMEESHPEVIVFHTEGQLFDKENYRNSAKQNKAISIFIGPEGGWSPKEIEMFHTYHYDIRCLGNQILRSETAVIAALSVIIF